MKKLLASDVVDIDDNFLDQIEERLKGREEAKKYKVNHLYNVDQVARFTSQSTQTIRRHIKDGLLEAVKIGKTWLISVENYNNYISKNNE